MSTNFKWLAVACMVGSLVACGGGGGDDGGVAGVVGGGGALAAPPIAGAPTATLTSSQQTANELAVAANAGAAAVNVVDGFSALPLGVQVALPTGVTTTETLSCTGGGTATLTENLANPNSLTVGDSGNLVLSNCAELGYVFSGTVALSITRFVNDDDLTSSFSASNLSVSEGGTTRGPLNFTGQIDIVSGQVAYSFNVDGSTVIGIAVVSRNGNVVTISDATTRVNIDAGGFVEIRYSGWVFDLATGRPSAGSATVTAANGDTASVIVQNDGYHWTITVNGVATTYTVLF